MTKLFDKFLLLMWLVPCFAFIGCNKVSRSLSPGSPQNYFKTVWQDESQFIVQTIITDLAEMSVFAKQKSVPQPGELLVVVQEKSDSEIDSPTYSILITLDKSKPAIKCDLTVNGPIWSPGIYTNLVRKIFDTIGTPTDVVAAGPQDTSLISNLTELTARNLQEQNLALSHCLEDNFCNPLLHEKAALLLGAFMLRDSSGGFFDLRSPLCRLTAHLALASQFSGQSGTGLNGRLANAILLTLINNQKTALENLAGIDAVDPLVQPWLRALRSRNTCDYRALASVARPSLLEKIELFRASCASIDIDIAWGKLSDKEKETVPDYCRVANANSYSVETGHELQAVSLALEIAELDQVYSLDHGTKLKKDKLTEALNTPPERCFSASGSNRIRVIGWGQWACFAQRHVCHALQHNFNFLKNKWGVPEEAAKFSKETEPLFSGLRIYPFVRWCNCTTREDYHRAVDEALIVTVNTPHLVSAEIWNSICYKVDFAELYEPNSNPHINEWHKHNPPPGTAYDSFPRMDHPSLVARRDVIPLMERLHELAPYECEVSAELLHIKYHDKPTFEQMEQVYYPLLEYHSSKINDLAQTVIETPDRYEKLMLRSAAIDPYRYYSLGEFFQERNQDEKAATYFEKAMALHPDSVAAASRSSWLIKYYQRKGMISKALALADKAAEVYSYSGLQAKADLLESLGKYDEAWEYFLKLEERYERSDDLMAFIARYKAKTGNTRYDHELQTRLGKLFPKGLEKATIQTLGSPPSDGAIIKQDGNLISDAGLKVGDIIVAVHAIRVHNMQQYSFARETRKAPGMELIVWQQNHYVEIKCSPPGHRFNVDFATYAGK
jgi:hypothetical protein